MTSFIGNFNAYIKYVVHFNKIVIRTEISVHAAKKKPEI